MKKIKQEKAITLVALIITIIILIVLAVVAVASINNYDIIGYADRATTKYKEEQSEENGVLQEYNTLVDKYGDKDENDGTESGESGTEDGGTVNTVTCAHTSTTIRYSIWDNYYSHYWEENCNICNGFINDGTEDHNYDSSAICTLCEFDSSKCTNGGSHSMGYYNINGHDSGGHYAQLICSVCDYGVRENEYEYVSHTFKTSGYCSCGYYNGSYDDTPYWS